MPFEKRKVPGALLLVLSALGILISLLLAASLIFSLVSPSNSASLPPDMLTVASAGGLALLTGLLHLPALIISIKALRGKATPFKQPSLFKAASLAGLGWLLILGAGVLAIRSQVSLYLFVPLTLLAVTIPVWWLVEYSRRGLPRSTALREWGTLTIGLSVTPLLIMLIEIIMVVVIALAALVVLSTQPAAMETLSRIMQILVMYQGGIDQLEKLLNELSRNPVVAGALFLGVGIIAPFIEELLKPMALWFLLKRPLKEHEGFSLGLISGGAFALLESAGLISQVSQETWVQAVVLRAVTGMLHIGLSGLMGYGLVSTWNQKRFGRAILYFFAAAGLHGAWNTFAMLSDFSAASTPAASAAEFLPTLGNILPVAGMLMVFGVLLFIVLRINKKLRGSLAEQQEILLPPVSPFSAE
jgi:hypothetical protein